MHISVAKCYVPDTVMGLGRMNGPNCQAKPTGINILNQNVLRAVCVVSSFIQWLNSKAVILIPNSAIMDINIFPRNVEPIGIERCKVANVMFVIIIDTIRNMTVENF